MAPGTDYADESLPILGCKRRAEKNTGEASGTRRLFRLCA